MSASLSVDTATDTLVMEPQAPYVVAIPLDASITDNIHIIRGQKVMLDRDLAELYGVEVKRLKEQVRRNASRFPDDFMFQLTKSEWDSLWSQFATIKQGAHIKYLPYAFSEHGILMLANVLRSERAIAVSIQIIRIFTRMREVLLSHREILEKLESLESKTTDHDADIQRLFDLMTEMVPLTEKQRKPKGFMPEK